jgi:ABC-2 type transport system permease protein
MAANTEFQRVGLTGWRTGFANLLRKENRAWWSLSRLLVQGLLWTVAVNGVVAFFVFATPLLTQMSGNSGAMSVDYVAIGTGVLFEMGCLFLAVGSIVLASGAIIGERQLGVTEWLLSKPVSRSAYVLSKLLAHGLGVLVVLVGLQGAIGYGLLSLKAGQPLPLLPYLVGVAGLAVHTVFYLTLTLMMGVLTANRNALLGVSLGVAIGGGVLSANILGQLYLWTPFALAKLSGAVVMSALSEVPLPVSIWPIIGITVTLSVIFMAVAVARFERLEF